jgi:RNA polymerase sigma-70 factor (ECF subfamily)
MFSARERPGGAPGSSDFDPVYDQYVDRVYAFVDYQVGSRDEAEDLTQQVFTVAWSKLGQFDERKGTLGQWLFGIARNEVRNFRRQGRRRLLPLDALSEAEEQADAAGPEDLVAKQQTEARLRELIGRLGERAQEIIALKFASELTNREIARVMDLSESNVGTILHRSLGQLREWMEAGSNGW